MTKKDTKEKKRTKKLRDTAIRAESMAGASNNEICEKYGLQATRVSRILNSEESKELVRLGEERLKLMMTKAIDTLEWAMDNKHEFGLGGMAFNSAKLILKNIGLAKESVDLNHKFPKPTVVVRPNGDQVILGTDEEDEK